MFTSLGKSQNLGPGEGGGDLARPWSRIQRGVEKIPVTFPLENEDPNSKTVLSE